MLSQVVSAVLVMMTLCRTSQVYRLQLKKIRFYGDMLVRIVRIGLPAGLQSVMYSLSNIIIQASVNGFGTDVMAAYTAYGNVDGMYCGSSMRLRGHYNLCWQNFRRCGSMTA